MTRDAGLSAVARVSDSRIGLSTALAEQRAAQGLVDGMRARLTEAADFQTGSASEFRALRQSLAALGDVLIAAEADRDSAAVISTAALDRWRHDKTRLNAIELLLERRASVRRADAARAEARELDDLAAQRWLRAEVAR
jgi:flagellar FliJ protein